MSSRRKSRRDPFPKDLVPMLAKLGTLPADEQGWAAEVKWDGVRAIAYCRAGSVELRTRNLNRVSAQYPEVQGISSQLGGHDAVLDGELVAFDADGKPSFERLQQRIHQTDEAVARRRMASHPVTYVVFDLLYLDGTDLMAEPYTRRRELLAGLGLDGPSWQTPGFSAGHLAELAAASKRQGLEGIVVKRLGSRYAPGKRNGTWLKVKNVGRQEFVIAGWQPGEGRRRGGVGSILLGSYEGDGKTLRYAGKVGTGFSEAVLADLGSRFAPLARPTSPYGAGEPPPAEYLEPELVAEIEFRELTAEGLVRHGAFKGLRDDKPPREVRAERVGSTRAAWPSAPRTPPR